MMKVLVVSSMYLRPGSHICGRAVHRQVLELVHLGVRVRVVEPYPVFVPPFRDVWEAEATKLRDTVSLDGVRVHRLPYMKLAPLTWAPKLGTTLLRRAIYRQIRAIWTEFQFNIVHAHFLFPTACATAGAADSLSLPQVSTAHGSDVHTLPEENRVVRRLVRNAIAKSSRTLAVSQGLAQQVRSLGGREQRVEVAYLGVDGESFRPAQDQRAVRKRLGLPRRGTGICCVARLVKEKGLRELFEAFCEVRASHSECWLLLVGDGPYREKLEDWAHEAGISSAVHLPGSRPHEEIGDWLNAADVFTLPSYNEGLPNVILEAMACGLPVVATDVGGVSEAVSQGESGILVEPGRVYGLQHALMTLVSDVAGRREMGRAGRGIVMERFTWEESARRVLSMYTEVLDEASSVDSTGSASRRPSSVRSA